MPSSSFLCDKRNEKGFDWKPKRDNSLQVLKTTTLQAWPKDKSKVPPLVTPYYSVKDELGTYDGLVLRGERLVVSQGLRADIKRKLHALHAGVEVAADLFTLEQKDYLVTVDYYSGYWQLETLQSTEAGALIKKLKAHFSRHRSPCQLVSDSGPQFVAAEFLKIRGKRNGRKGWSWRDLMRGHMK